MAEIKGDYEIKGETPFFLSASLTHAVVACQTDPC